mgnify:CR=1 FL=1
MNKKNTPEQDMTTTEQAIWLLLENTLSELNKVPFIITEPPKFPEIPEYKFNAYEFTGESARNIRREQERKKAKSKRNGK